MISVSEIIALGGVLVSAGSAIERMRRLENSNRDQGRRIGALEHELARLRSSIDARHRLEAELGIIRGRVPTNDQEGG